MTVDDACYKWTQANLIDVVITSTCRSEASNVVVICTNKFSLVYFITKKGQEYRNTQKQCGEEGQNETTRLSIVIGLPPSSIKV